MLQLQIFDEPGESYVTAANLTLVIHRDFKYIYKSTCYHSLFFPPVLAAAAFSLLEGFFFPAELPF
jgi:hypothetical protein